MSTGEFKIYANDVETYYEALGIPHDRAKDLIQFSILISKKEEDISLRMKECYETAANVNELAFLIFKVGEISGIHLAIRNPEGAKRFMTSFLQ